MSGSFLITCLWNQQVVRSPSIVSSDCERGTGIRRFLLKRADGPAPGSCARRAGETGPTGAWRRELGAFQGLARWELRAFEALFHISVPAVPRFRHWASGTGSSKEALPLKHLFAEPEAYSNEDPSGQNVIFLRRTQMEEPGALSRVSFKVPALSRCPSCQACVLLNGPVCCGDVFLRCFKLTDFVDVAFLHDTEPTIELTFAGRIH